MKIKIKPHLSLPKLTLHNLLRWGIYLFVFLFPVFFLPFSFEVVEFSKTYLAVFGGVVLFLLWLLKMIIEDKKITVRLSFLDFLIFLFLAIAVISTFLSSDRYLSLFGSYGRFSTGFFALIGFVLFYLVLSNNLEEEKGVKISTIFLLLIISTFVSLVFEYFSLFGIFQKLAPRLIFENPASNSRLNYALFLSLFIALSLGYLFVKKKISLGLKILIYLFVFLALVVLFIFDFDSAWILLGILLALFILLYFRFRLIKEEVPRFILPIFLIVFAFVALILNTRAVLFDLFGNALPQNFITPAELVLPLKYSWEMAFDSAIDSIKNFFLGNGPSTFLYTFTQFKSLDLNRTNWVQTRFDRFSSVYAEILSTLGFAGFLIFLLICLFPVYRLLRNGQIEEEKRWMLVLSFLLLFGVVILQIFGYQQAINWFLLVLSLSLVKVFGLGKRKEFALSKRPGVFLFAEAIFVFLVILFLFGLFYGIKFYQAEAYYKKGFFEPDLTKKVEFFEKAVRANSYVPRYRLVLANAYFAKMQNELQKPKEKVNRDEVINNLQKAIAVANNTARLFPHNIVALETLAQMYRDVAGIVEGASTQGIEAYKKAIEIDPKNPYLYLELGKLQFQEKKYKEARESFNKALVLWPQFYPAKIQLALIDEQEGKENNAIFILESLAEEYPNDPEIFFHLGRLYYNQDKIDKAIETLEKAIAISPFYSNARFVLASAYEKKGDLNKALEHLKLVESLNPDNKVVKDKIKEIETKLQGKSLESEEESPEEEK